MKLSLIAGLVISFVLVGTARSESDSPSRLAETQAPTSAALESSSAPSLEIQSAPASSPNVSGKVSTAKAEWQGLKADIKSTAEVLERLSADQRRKWDTAVAALPGFCHEWERLLHNREVDNLTHLNWKFRDGYQTATYIGYSKIEACEAKESAQGIPIGKVVYDEKNYYLAGKTVDEAKNNPKLLGTTSTLEIFSWEKDRWFY